jgi:hypothetical protein
MEEVHPMTAVVERDEVSELAVHAGWHRRDADRSDYYTRQLDRVRVIWQGNEAISGGVLYRDGILMSLTRDLDTVKAWLKR